MERNYVRRALYAAISAIVLVFAATGMALAQTAVTNIGHAYVGATAGIIIPEDLDATFSGGLAGTGRLSFNAGPAFTGLIGFHFNNYLAVEGELGYASFDEKTFSGTLNGTSVSFAIDGRVNTALLFANGIITPFGRSGVTPYLGAGAGLVNFDERVNTLGGVAVNSTSNETDLAANFIAGIDFAISNRWSVGGRYRFVWVNTSSTTTSGGITTSQGDFTAHVLTATGTFHF
jgi:opacity protein-like surface antigen